MPRVEGLGARRAALQILDAVLRQGRTLDAAADKAGGLAPNDKALAIGIAGETLRRIPDLDALIDGATRQRLPDDSKARMVLRLALAQKAGLGTPDHALVATALPLVDGGPRRLVHGVLGTLLRRGLPDMSAPRLPDDVEARWEKAWGADAVATARRQIASRPALDLSFADDAVAKEFAAHNAGTSLTPRHVRLDSSAVAELPGFEAGGWWVQDLAASLPARMIPGDAVDVIDLCAAPGGKTMQLAAAGHKVTAIDNSKSRLGRLRENLERTRLTANLIEADALTFSPGRQVDAILLDAPCSSTGTFRRHPEVLYRARPKIIADSAALQRRLLDRAASWLRPGGALIYAVCSLEPEEGEDVVSEWLAANQGFAIAVPADGELPAVMTPSPEGWVRILPGLIEAEGGLDGFFMARLVRNR
ncbi:RsmB/NOP family class I SAM-dependent RNA methyltransferase [Sphingomonas lutea]|uniref:RsmB/NOP family class I SAM-dependent RNA methyltransferase n=1 Tax=Sphingomonas lutea TaxID=1045317 RepID=A0A7G9SIF5_9SPHN|nr:RsmB/NOP family class I SAM-dependent RNA methyltransferase [Sphingomonas lutea]QNN67630.1 RsmB/NOP family class I SAM-dependent RNA methyltransferase [Sphingomonas lutea]